MSRVVCVCVYQNKLLEATWVENDPGAKVTDELADEWQQKANQFLQCQLPEHKTKVRKFKRVVGYRHLLSIDHALQTAGSKGLAALQTSSGDWDNSIRELAATRGDDVQPTLSVAVDQGGGLFSALWYLNYVLHICLVIISDLSHRAWNDATGALKDTKLWSFIVVHVICINAEYGPFDGSKLDNKMQEAKDAFVNNFGRGSV